jgi:hypothetical protein
MTQPILRYKLIKPRLWMRAGGYYFGDPVIAINGQYDNYLPIKCGNDDLGFESFKDLITDYYCKNAGMYGARSQPNQYELRAVLNHKLVNNPRISSNEIKVLPFHVDESDPKGKVTFPINQSEYEKLLLGQSIDNLRYKPAKESWFRKAINSVFQPKTQEQVYHPQPIEVTEKVNKYEVVNDDIVLPISIQTPVIEVKSRDITDEFLTETIELTQTSQSIPTEKVDVYHQTAYTPQTNNSALMAIEKPKVISKPNYLNVIGKSVAYGALAGGLLFLLNSMGKQQAVPQFSTGNNSPTISLVPTPPPDAAIDQIKIKEFDNVAMSYTPQTASVCKDLESPPTESAYESGKNSKWFKIDNAKHNECKISTLMSQLSSITDQRKIQSFKSQFAPQATLHFNQSLAWYAQ